MCNSFFLHINSVYAYIEDITSKEPNLFVSKFTLKEFPDFSEDIFLYKYTNQETNEEILLIPFTDFNKIMYIAIDEKEGGIFQGWFIKQNKTITIDTNTNTFSLQDKTSSIEPNNIFKIDGQVYISQQFLESILPIKILFNQLDQIFTVETLEKFPIEENLIRKRQIENFDKKNNNSVEQALINEKYKMPTYKAISTPTIDINATTTFNNNTNNTNTNFATTSHLGYFSLNTSGNSQFIDSKHQNSVVRMRLAKNFFEKPTSEHDLHIKQFEIGDINIPSLDGVLNSKFGLGAKISNLSPTWRVNFNKLLVTGSTVPNWDLEIYVNNSLYSFTTVPESGIYQFEDIPLNIGYNSIKLVFYGPFGERREVIKDINFTGTQISKGAFFYDIATIKPNTFILNKINLPNQTNKNVEDLRFQYGLTNFTTLQMNYSSFEPLGNLLNNTNPGKKEEYLQTTLVTSIGTALLSGTLANQIGTKNTLASSSLSFNIGTGSIFLKTSQLIGDYISDISNTQSANIKQSHEVRLTQNTKIFSQYFGHNLQFITSTRQDAQAHNILNYRISTTLLKMNLSNGLTYNKNGNQDANINGNFIASYRLFSNIIFRSNFNYIIQPVKSLQSTTAQLNYNTSNTLGYSFALTHNPSNNLINSNIGVNMTLEKLIFSINGGHASNNTYSIGLTVASNFYPHKDGIFTSNKSVANAGIANVNAFYDDNNDGVLNNNEQPVEDLDLDVNGFKTNVKTNTKGRAILNGLNTFAPVKIQGNFSKKDEILKVTNPSHGNVVLLPGLIEDVSLPIVRTGDIEGYVYIKIGNETKHIAGIPVMIVDENDNIIATEKTAYDGYYFIQSIPTGNYKIVVDEKSLQHYKTQHIKTQQENINQDLIQNTENTTITEENENAENNEGI